MIVERLAGLFCRLYPAYRILKVEEMPRTLTIHNFYPRGRPESVQLEQFAAQVALASDRRLAVIVEHANRLGLDDADGFEWLAQGNADLAILWPVYLQRKIPELQASYIMGSARNLRDHMSALPVLESIDRQILSERGLVAIATLPSPVLYISIFSSGQPVTSLETLYGRRLRVFSQDLEPTFRRLGADANFIPQGELYAAFEAGRFDCTVYPACHTAWSVPLWRVTQHAAYLFPEALHPYLLCCAPQTWASLNQTDRVALEEAAQSVYPAFLRHSLDDTAELAARRNLQAAGMTWHSDFSASDQGSFAASAARTWQDLAEQAGGRAPANFRDLMAAMRRPV